MPLGKSCTGRSCTSRFALIRWSQPKRPQLWLPSGRRTLLAMQFPPASSQSALERMTRQRSRDTGTELKLRSALHKRGLRYRLHQNLVDGLRREVDIVFKSARVAVFVDGCFWHRCPVHGSVPRSNSEFWVNKLSANEERDRDTNRRLTAEGWLVVRVWEHDSPEKAAKRIQELVTARSAI